jgi:predicted N-acetyltransferase YhbS
VSLSQARPEALLIENRTASGKFVNQLRSLEPADIPQIVALRRRVFSQPAQESDAALARFYRTIFFENPWHDERYPSLVHEGAAGEILGFVGSIPRPILLGAERLTAVTATELMVAPEARGGLVGLKLMRRLFDGAQQVTWSDRGNESGRALYEGLGGSVAPWYSLYWSASLDGSELRFDTGVGRGPRNVAARAVRRASRLLDRLSKSSLTQNGIATRDEPLTAETVMSFMRGLAEKNTLVSEYDARSFEWLMLRLAETQKFERVVTAQVTHEGEAIGFFVYAIRRDGEIDVVQLAALAGREALTFDHLIRHAVGNGGTVLRGRLDRRFGPLISERGLPLTLGQPWTIVRSGRPDVTAQLLNGRALLSRLDAEWWINP